MVIHSKFRTLEGSYINIHQPLIDACRTGDRSAQFKIYKLYYKAMFNTSLRIVNDQAEAEDIMQESFLEAFQRLNSYTGEGSFGSWLKRIVINNSLDSLRRKKEMVPIGEEQFELPADAEDRREEEILFQVKEVRDAIAGLPEDYRVILSLYLLEGYDHEEISEILNISNQLSRTRFSRARQKLLDVLKNRMKQNSYIYN
jgi:RNA polymerase sigma-70 factor (ECF subfamily)